MDSLTITIIFIALATVVGAFVKGRMRDRCLLDFTGDLVNVELKEDKVIKGILQLEATGFELAYNKPCSIEKDNYGKAGFILYKNEYAGIRCIVRFVDDLDDESKTGRERFLKQIRRQKGLRRRARNFFATVRDSIMEVINLLMGRVKQGMPAGSVLSGQDKYVSEMQAGAFSLLNASFEPLLEKHIGDRVILQLTGKEGLIEHRGVLKNYTAEFLELMDISYCRSNEEEARPADIIVPRSTGLIRYLSIK